MAQPVLGLCLFAVVLMMLWIHIDVNVNHYNTQMDGDIASEAITGKVIAENGFRVPETWYPSTGYRIIAPPNLAALIYPLVGKDMNLSAGLSCSIFMIIILALMYYYLRQVGFGIVESLCSILILFSLSNINWENQSMFFLWGAHYASHFVAMFLVLIFYNRSLRKGKASIPVFVVFTVFALINGIQGMHSLIYIFFPLLGVEVFRRLVLLIRRNNGWRENCSIPVWLMVMGVVSYLGTKVYSIMSTSRNIRHAAEKFVEQVWPALKGVVYVDMCPVLVAPFCVLAAAGFLIVLVKLLAGAKNEGSDTDASLEDKNETGDRGLLWSMLTFPASMAIWMILATFTTSEVAPRYFISELFLVAFGLPLFMRFFYRKYSVMLAVPVAVLAVIAGRYYYDELIVNDHYMEREEYKLATWMIENGYEYGYASFDFAATITVMSNDRVHVRPIDSFAKLNGNKWLADSNWYPPAKSVEGETCYFVTDRTEPDIREFIEANNPEIVRIDHVERFTIYVFDHDYSVFE